MKNSIPKFYENLYANERESVFGKPEKELVKFLQLIKFKKNARALDLGCGDGRNLIYLAKKDFITLGLDSSSTGLKKIKNKINSSNFSKNIYLKKADLKTAELKKNYFDFVICIYTLHEIGVQGVKHIIRQAQIATRNQGINYLAFFSPRQGTFLRKDAYYPNKSAIINLYKGWRVLIDKTAFSVHSHRTPYSGDKKTKHKHCLCHLFLQKS